MKTPVKPGKQLLELLNKKVSLKILKFQRKTPVLKSFLMAFSCGIGEIFKNNYFEEHPQATASEICSFTWIALFDNLWCKLVPTL